MSQPQDVLTTGQVAKICNVAPRTVTKWFDSGELRGYRIPGSKDRRIPLDKLVSFLKMHGMPLKGLDGRTTRVLLVDPDAEFADGLRQAMQNEKQYEVHIADCAFSTGALAERHRPHVIVVDLATPGLDGRALCRHVHASQELRNAKLIATSTQMSDVLERECLREGFNCCLTKPFNCASILEVLEGAIPVAG